MSPIVYFIIGIWAISIIRTCSNNGKSIPLALGIYAVLVVVMIFVIRNPIMPATISALVTYGIMYLVPAPSTSSTSSPASPMSSTPAQIGTMPMATAASSSAGKACPDCKKLQLATAAVCIDCGRRLA